jgi:hypothetical protein
MKNKYRIIKDDYNGYEAQIKYWWLPFLWIEMHEPGFICNTWETLDRAKNFINNRKNTNKSNKVIYWESNK